MTYSGLYSTKSKSARYKRQILRWEHQHYLKTHLWAPASKMLTFLLWYSGESNICSLQQFSSVHIDCWPQEEQRNRIPIRIWIAERPCWARLIRRDHTTFSRICLYHVTLDGLNHVHVTADLSRFLYIQWILGCAASSTWKHFQPAASSTTGISVQFHQAQTRGRPWTEEKSPRRARLTMICGGSGANYLLWNTRKIDFKSSFERDSIKITDRFIDAYQHVHVGQPEYLHATAASICASYNP